MKSQNKKVSDAVIIKIVKRPRCIICKKKLKHYEANLCSCEENVCIKHSQKVFHDCKLSKKIIEHPRIVASKIDKI